MFIIKYFQKGFICLVHILVIFSTFPKYHYYVITMFLYNVSFIFFKK